MLSFFWLPRSGLQQHFALPSWAWAWKYVIVIIDQCRHLVNWSNTSKCRFGDRMYLALRTTIIDFCFVATCCNIAPYVTGIVLQAVMVTRFGKDLFLSPPQHGTPCHSTPRWQGVALAWLFCHFTYWLDKIRVVCAFVCNIVGNVKL